MAKFLKHIGKVGERKVAIIFREIPGDTHMALVVYTETLNQNIHDPLMRCIESAEGQEAKNLGEALNRAYTMDGKIILQVLHGEGMMKKMQTEQIVMTPTPNVKSHIRLSELNALLDEMEKGEEAIKRLAEIDASRGLQDPKDVARRIRESEKSASSSPVSQPHTTDNGVMSDKQLADMYRQQAKGFLAEYERLMRQASEIDSAQTNTTVSVNTKPKTRRTKKEVSMT